MLTVMDGPLASFIVSVYYVNSIRVYARFHKKKKWIETGMNVRRFCASLLPKYLKYKDDYHKL